MGPYTGLMAGKKVDSASEASPKPVGGWLEEDELLAWRAISLLLMQLPGRLEAQLQRDSGISFFEYIVMSAISMTPEREVRMSELAHLTNASPSRLSNVVKRLEQLGWIVRRTHECDGRSTVAVLTNSGMDLVRQAAPGHVDAVRANVIEPLSAAQLDALRTVGEHLYPRLSEFKSADPAC
jgi:DNA-binding MarR family transcriptional regulator